MKKVSLFIGVLLVLAFATPHKSRAQEGSAPDSTSNWTKSTSLGLNFSNVGLENWAGGGVSSLALGFVGQFIATRETETSVWTNQVDLAYGLQKQDGNETFRKTDDQFIFDSKFGYKLSENFLVSSALNFRTQMDNGYLYELDAQGDETRTIISKLMAPGYLTLNLGMTFKQKKWLILTFSPLTLKNTFVLDETLSDAGAFGVDPGKSLRSEFGTSLTGSFNLKDIIKDEDIAKNVNITTAFSLFANYENLDAIDVNWETLLSMKVNKYLNASFGTQLIYDEDVDVERNDGTVGPAVQFKHVLNVGLGITF